MTDQEKETKARYIVNILKDCPYDDREEIIHLVDQEICLRCGSEEGKKCCCYWDD